jgi:solute carrier family 25 protein 38
MSFFNFTTDPSTNSLIDNQLKTEINNIKATLYKSEYKTKLVVVLIGDKHITSSLDIEDRLSTIRRATGLDTKTSFFFLPPTSSAAEVEAFVDGMLTALQPGCVEYYRDLTKHSRRKKARGNVPAPTAPPTRGTSQTLAAVGWGVRYDFKLGVFAEFRQEMESACRHYTAALEALLGPDGIFETTASWSPRWEQARLLADIVAMRILRCLLWSNLTTTAVQSWSNYRHRLRELIDRRGKGTTNYGWEAWESRWSRMMAELVRRANLPAFTDFSEREEFKIYAPVEKAIPVGERIRPFDHLHHSGYWYRIAAKHGRRRRRIASDLPEDDCTPPGQSPASAMASRYGTYDTYLCPEPWQERPTPERKTYNHSKEIFHALEKAQKQFRAQPRSRSELCLEMARELIRNRQYPDAMKLLFHLWTGMSWRKDQWWELVFEVTRNLRECAKQLGDAKVLAATEFEMYSDQLPISKTFTYALMRCGEGLQASDRTSMIETDVIELDADRIASFVSTKFTFETAKGSAGEPLRAQLVVTSTAQRESLPVIFESINIALTGAPFLINLTHEKLTTDTLPSELQHIELADLDDATKTGAADLQLGAGKQLVFDVGLIFREAGPVAVQNVVLALALPAAMIRFTTVPEEMSPRADWYKSSPAGLITTPVARDDSHTVEIRPRPPKMNINMPNVNEHFYTDEELNLSIEVTNGEEEATESTLEVRVLDGDGEAEFRWLDSSDSTAPSEHVSSHAVGILEPSKSKTSTLVFAAPALPTSYVVEVKVLYHLSSDPATPVSKTFTADLNVTRAFEANYEFQPRVHTEPWPSFFDKSTVGSESESSIQHGIAQQWELLAQIASFTYEGIIMSNVELLVESISTHATAISSPTNSNEEDLEVAPQQQLDRAFIVDVTKTSLEDRRSVELELVLAISWRRPRGTKTFTSLLPVNTFVLENGPRILASITYPKPLKHESDEDELDVLPVSQLTFTLENPTNHFLTFEMSMEGPQKDDWALSGPKLSSLNLLPLSREAVNFRIVPLTASEINAEDGMWLEVRFRVMDVYFRKVLRCLPASSNIREAEGKGGSLLVWVGSRS